MEPFVVEIEAWLAGLGPWAWGAAPLVMAFVAVFPVPAEAPAMVNGMLFGPVAGSVVTWTGAMLGAVISFELARHFGRPLAERFLPARTLDRIDAAVKDAGWPALLAARFVPVIAFTVLNWGAGMTPAIPRWRFLWTTAVGILPGAVLFTASGSGLARLLGDLSPVAALVSVAIVAALMGWAWRRRPRRSGQDPPGPPPAGGPPGAPETQDPRR